MYVMDVTFFGKKKSKESFWILSVYNCTYKRVIYAKEVKTESIQVYQECYRELSHYGWQIAAIVCDGKPGVMWWFQKQWIPVQMCHFHMHQIITRKIGLYPKSLVARELKQLLSFLTRSSYESFYDRFMQRFITHYTLLNERSEMSDQKRKWRYKHEKIRSAYMSILRLLPSLFTYRATPFCFFPCPNTTNHLDGWIFSHLKEKTNLHRWKTKTRKLDIIFELLFKTNIKK